MGNYFVIKFVSEPRENESRVRSVIGQLAQAEFEPVQMQDVSDLKFAAGEILTNAIIHGYRGREGWITVKLSFRDRIAKITVSDKGTGIENIEEALKPNFTTLPGERSGIGFNLTQAVVENLEIESEVGKGTTVSFIKRFK